MDKYVTELIDYIDTYRSLIERGLYDKNKQKEIDELGALMDQLSASYDSKSGLDTFDFQQLRKRVSFIFHPDVYKIEIPKELEINLSSLNARFNGTISSILKDKKEGYKFTYKYHTTTSSTPNNEGQYSTDDDWGYGSFRENARRYRGYYDERGSYHTFEEDREKEERRARRQEAMSAVKERVKDAARSAYEYSKERLGAWLFDIPSTQKDYYNIKNSLTADIESLKYRKTLAIANTKINEQKKESIVRRWNKEVSREELEKRYNDEVINSYNRVEHYRRQLESARQLLMSRLDMHAPEYRSLMMKWEQTAGEIFADFMNSRVELKNKQDGYAPNNGRSERDIMKSIKKYEKELDRYPKRKKAEDLALEAVTKNDQVYKQLKENCDKMLNAYNEAMKSHNILTANKEHIIKLYVKEINKKYNATVFGLELRIKRFQTKDKNLERDIEHSKERLQVFVDTYGPTFARRRATKSQEQQQYQEPEMETAGRRRR